MLTLVSRRSGSRHDEQFQGLSRRLARLEFFPGVENYLSNDANDRSKDQDDIEIVRSVADMADRPLLAGGLPLCFRCASPESETRQVIQVRIQKRARAIEQEKAKVDCDRKAAELEDQAKVAWEQAKLAQKQAKSSRDQAQQHQVYVNGLFRRRYITALLHSEHKHNRHRGYNRFATDIALILMVRLVWK